MQLQKNQREKILNTILGLSGYLGRFEDSLMSFLSRVWSLRDMPSTDERFKTAYEDIYQHMINNNDWEERYLYVDVLKLLDADDKTFQSFLENVVNPEVRLNKDEILQYVALLNNALKETTLRLALVDYFEGLPMYRLIERTETTDLPVDIAKNNIKIYRGSPTTYPCLNLSRGTWDDYGFKTTMTLVYYENEQSRTTLGSLKICKKGEYETWDQLEAEFTSLGQEFVSLGQNKKYYEEVKRVLGPQYQSVLFALRDAAFFPTIHEQFENERGFRRSLLRENNVEQLLRTIRYELNGLDLKNCFVFYYHFTPPYSKDKLSFFFDFRYHSDLDHRVFALIGKNGTGKTRLLATLAKDLSKRESESIRPKRPLYAKVFTVSYSYFDRFDIPDGDAEFNYVYCGLKKRDGTQLNNEELMERFFKSADKIIEKELVEQWYLTLQDFIPEDLLNQLFHVSNVRNIIFNYKFLPEMFGPVYQQLSSGQNILVYIVTEILSQIRYNSLILYDEPETHLHPNAISSLIYTIFNMVKRFDSFCIIATHSPIVIQEIPSRNIYVIVRDNEHAELRKLEKESFGENLTVITDEIFGNREIAKHQYQVLEDLVKSNKSYEEILKIIQSDNLPVPLSTRLFLKSLMEKGNEKS